MGDTCLGLVGGQVEDGGARGFAACAGCCGDCDEGAELVRDGQAFAQRGVDKVHEICFVVGGVQVHELGGVDDGAAAYGEEGVWREGLRPGDGFFDAGGGLEWGGGWLKVGGQTSNPLARSGRWKRPCS